MTTTPTGLFSQRDEGDAVSFVRTFNAPIDDVWAAVTESDRLARWIGFFTGDPEQGHVEFTMNAEGDDVTPARYDIRRCEPPRILQVHTTDDFGTWDLIVELVEKDNVTTLTLSQIIHDPTTIENTGPGWEYYLDRLVAALTGADPGAIDFDDYYPAQQEYYLAIQGKLTGGK
ncbi:SRPBCC family protein [Williamsia soli]|uniref:SRPBCC family protein n=1 Tax=Williamsia soli TaxID=364929 RepID=UPI001A9FEE6D|nr:SRPBCC family protein [Williamsia soli]